MGFRAVQGPRDGVVHLQHSSVSFLPGSGLHVHEAHLQCGLSLVFRD